jgi:hypothetical protein
MVDLKSYYDEIGSRPEFVSEIDDRGKWISDCSCPVCEKKGASEVKNRAVMDSSFRTLMSINVNEDPSPLHYFLCPWEIPVYIFQTRRWGEYEALHVPRLGLGLSVAKNTVEILHTLVKLLMSGPPRACPCQQPERSVIPKRHDQQPRYGQQAKADAPSVGKHICPAECPRRDPERGYVVCRLRCREGGRLDFPAPR